MTPDNLGNLSYAVYAVLGIGFIVGMLFPFYVAYFQKQDESAVPKAAKKPAVLAIASIINGFRFALYSLVITATLMFVVGTIYSLYAIVRDALF